MTNMDAKEAYRSRCIDIIAEGIGRRRYKEAEENLRGLRDVTLRANAMPESDVNRTYFQSVEGLQRVMWGLPSIQYRVGVKNG